MDLETLIQTAGETLSTEKKRINNAMFNIHKNVMLNKKQINKISNDKETLSRLNRAVFYNRTEINQLKKNVSQMNDKLDTLLKYLKVNQAITGLVSMNTDQDVICIDNIKTENENEIMYCPTCRAVDPDTTKLLGHYGNCIMSVSPAAQRRREDKRKRGCEA